MENSNANDGRCIRNDGKYWRCSFPRSGGSRLCEKHHAYYLLRSSKSRVRVSGSTAINKKNSCKIAPESSSTRQNRKHRRPRRMLMIQEIVESSVSTAWIEEEKEVTRVVKLGEIWAFSKECDGAPRSYARIDRIIPTPSLVKVKLLSPCLITDEEKIFAKGGLPLSCGLFKVSESPGFIMEISEFGHKVSVEIEEEESSLFKIFPKKGEVWAVYLNWDGVKRVFEYKLVEIEADFSEEEGLKVIGLVKVEGMDRVYQRQVLEEFYLVRSFSRGFMPMFSHQVAACRVGKGDETLWKLN